MTDLEKLSIEIQKLRSEVQHLIEQKKSLQDAEILEASKKLDTLLNEYDKLLLKKIKAE